MKYKIIITTLSIVSFLFAIFWLIKSDDKFEPIITIIGIAVVIISLNNSKEIIEIKEEVRDKEIPITFEEFEYYVKTFLREHKGLKIALTFYKNTNFSWIYEEGRSVIEIINNPKKKQVDKIKAIDEFLLILEKTFNEKIIINKYKDRRDHKFHFTKTYDILKKYLIETRTALNQMKE